MGVKPLPTTFGLDCLRCYAAGETPDTVKAFFSGIEKSPSYPHISPPPPNGSFTLKQTSNPCQWLYEKSGGWRSTYSLSAGNSLLTIDRFFAYWAFSGNPSVECEKYFTNVFQNPSTNAYNYGYAYVTTSAAIAEAVAKIVPYFEDGTRFEVYPGPDGIIDIRYANEKHRQNITIQLDTAEL